MIIKHGKKLKLQLACMLSFNFLVWMNLNPRTFAQTNINTHSQDTSDTVLVSYHKQPKPPDRGTPGAARGTGSRGSCFSYDGSAPLTSLVGNNSLTKTLNEYPTILIYVPFSVAETPTAEFVLQDEENDLYRTTIQLPSDIPGVVQIELPKTVAPLKIDKSYRWYFEIQCPSVAGGKNNLSTSETLTGVVRKVQPSPELNYDLETSATEIESIKTLAKHGIWYDSVNQMAQLRLENPLQTDYEKLWKELLCQPNVGLHDVSDKKILKIN